MKRLWIPAILACIGLVSPASFSAERLQEIVTQQKQVAKQLDDGSLRVTPREREIVAKAQSDVFSITDGKTSLSELNVAEKTRLESALERINAVVKGDRRAQETQEVCWRERRTGSKLMVTRCGTKEEIEQAREGARGHLERPRTCQASATSSCGQ